MRQLYFGTLVLALCCSCADNVKYGLFRNTCFKDLNTMAVGKALKVTITFIKKYSKKIYLVIKWSKKISLEQFVPITYTLENKLFAAATSADL